MSWGWRKILQVRLLVRQYIWYRLGDGSKVSAWFDNWCAISPLYDIIPNLDIYRAGFQVSSKVSELIVNGNWVWPTDWPVKFPSLSSIIVSHLPNTADGLCWKNMSNADSDFSVAVAWECIRPRDIEVGWYHLVWFSHHIPRHAVHLWLVIKRKLKTQDTLKQWDVGSNTDLNLLRCPLCDTQPDSHDHLFFECVFSMQVWKQLISFICMPNVPVSLSLIVDFLNPLANKRTARSVIVKLVFAASCYFIWQERNNILCWELKIP
ncbi:reverse transcriptase domain, reverse transcriptase zinc-binding domain protein [Tanacetum coccineum]